MNMEKMSSDEVPRKFTEWLLAMGCPTEKVPTEEKINEMCRGQYHMVWRSLMEQVHARDVIRNKRLQVFCDDVRKCQKNNVFTENSSSTIVPEQLTLWKQQKDVHQKVNQSEERVSVASHDLQQLMEKISTKMAQRAISRSKVEDASRRAWLLQRLADELRTKKADLDETKNIAHSLCSIDDDTDVQSKLDKCLAAFRQQSQPQDCNTTANSVCSSSGEADFETLVWGVTKCRGDVVSNQLLQRRAALIRTLNAASDDKGAQDRISPQSVLAHTAALHCTLALEATKNKVHLKQTRKKLLNTITELNNCLSGEACELLVLRCEKAHLEARVTSLKLLLDEATSKSGVFHAAGGEERSAAARNIAALDKAIENKKEELRRTIAALAATGRKMQNARDCLTAAFAAFHKDAAPHSRGVQLDMPQESMTSLREYYEARRERRKARVDLSLDLEVSDGSISDCIDYNNPRFVDELRIYLKKFNLDKNRQLVLENGEKIWLFETVRSSAQRFLASCIEGAASCATLCPSAPGSNVASLVDVQIRRLRLQASLDALGGSFVVKEIDISSSKQEEEATRDRTKKRLREVILEIQKIEKALALSAENLKFWSENNARKYISHARKVDSMSYREYESEYLDNCINI